MAWQKNGTPDTLGGNADLLTISDLTPLQFNVMLNHNLITGAGNHNTFRVGNGSIDTTASYSDRHSQNGATDITDINFTRALVGINAAADSTFNVMYGINITTEEKLFIGWEVNNPTTGAGTAPARMEYVWKWVDTTNQFDQFQARQESGSGDYIVNSNLSALGTD